MLTTFRTFQLSVRSWVLECFGPRIADDIIERNYRFLEESLELVQSLGCTRADCLALVDYVYGRDRGQPVQEVGGVMVTLAALCAANYLDMQQAAEHELARIMQPEIMAKIRSKQAAKAIVSPLDPLPIPNSNSTIPAPPAPTLP